MMVTVSQMAEGVAQPEGSVKKVQISDGLSGQRTRKQIGCDWQDQRCNSQGPVQMEVGDPYSRLTKNFKTETAENETTLRPL